MTEEEVRTWVMPIIDELKPGIYAIFCLVSGKVYIGQQKQKIGFRGRWNQHRYRLNKRGSGNDHLVAAWRKYGAENFKFIAIENCSTDDLCIRESHYLNKVPKEYRYNIAPISNLSPGNPEHRLKQSERMKAYYAKNPDKRTNPAIASQNMKAFWISEAGQKQKLKFSENFKGRKGKSPTEQQRLALRQFRLGKKHTEDTKRKIGQKSKGHTLSEESREKIRQSKLGKPRPPHVIQAISRGRSRKHPDQASFTFIESKVTTP